LRWFLATTLCAKGQSLTQKGVVMEDEFLQVVTSGQSLIFCLVWFFLFLIVGFIHAAKYKGA